MLEKLKEYRDLIGLAIFFVSGWLWIQNQFPTKTDLTNQLGVVKCQLKSYMSLTQDELHAQDLTAKIQQINQQLEAFSPAGGQISPSITAMLDQQKTDRQNYLNDLQSTNSQMLAISQSLERQECGQ